MLPITVFLEHFSDVTSSYSFVVRQSRQWSIIKHRVDLYFVESEQIISLEFADRVSETQLQVGQNSNFCYKFVYKVKYDYLCGLWNETCMFEGEIHLIQV